MPSVSSRSYYGFYRGTNLQKDFGSIPSIRFTRFIRTCSMSWKVVQIFFCHSLESGKYHHCFVLYLMAYRRFKVTWLTRLLPDLKKHKLI